MSKSVKKVLVFGLLLGAFVTTLQAQSTACKNNAVNQCASQCGVVGECIFGCQIGGVNNADVCNESCTGLGAACLNSCFKVVNQIATCAYVTGDITVNWGALVYNRATQVWEQTVRITNTNTTATMYNVAYVLDSLVSGWTLTNGNGVTSQLAPSGSPFKNCGSLAPGATTIVTLTFSRTGTPSFGYLPRVVTSSAR